MDLRMIYNKFLVADSLSNIELVALRCHFKVLSDNLRVLGERFRLACNEACETYHRLDDMCNARDLDIKKYS